MCQNGKSKIHKVSIHLLKVSTSTEHKKQKKGHGFDKRLETVCIFHFETIILDFTYAKMLHMLGGHRLIGQIYLWLPHLLQNCHFCTKNEIFYTILHTTVHTLKAIDTRWYSMNCFFLSSAYPITKFTNWCCKMQGRRQY